MPKGKKTNQKIYGGFKKNKMKIYIVYRDCNYDGSEIIGAFLTKEKAIKAKNNYLSNNRWCSKEEIEIEETKVI